MECRDDNDDDDDASDKIPAANTPTHKRNYILPNNKKKFNRANHRSCSKKQRTAAAAAAAAGAAENDVVQSPAAQPAAIATPTPNKRRCTQQPKRYQTQQIQMLTKKAEGFFNECAKVQGELQDEKTQNEDLRQQLRELQQQLLDEKNAHKEEMNELKEHLSNEKSAREKEVKELGEQLIMEKSAREKDVQQLRQTHKVEKDKLSNLLQSQQQRYKEKLSSTIDVANKRYDEAKALKSEAMEIKRDACKEAMRVVMNEREHSACVQQRQREKHRAQLDQVITAFSFKPTAKCTTSAIPTQQQLNDTQSFCEDEELDNMQSVKQLEERVVELEAEVNTLKQNEPKVIKKEWIRNKDKKGGAETWPSWVVVLIMEWLSNRTPPSCIAANILSLCSHIMPSVDVAEQLPSINYIRSVRSLLVVVTKTLAAYNVAKIDHYAQFYTDGTTRRQTEVNNGIVGYMTERGHETITLNNMILARDKKSVSLMHAILRTFEEAQDLLKGWIEVTKELFPGEDELVALIPSPDEATLLKLRNGFITTDTASPAKNLRKELKKAIENLAAEKGLTGAAFDIFECDCWNHLRNLWIEHAVTKLEKVVKGHLADDLQDIPSIYRVDIDVSHILRAIDKEFGITANYAKGHGTMFQHWMGILHPGAALYPTARMLGGTRQDSVTEGSLPAYMNRHFYIEFLHQRLCSGTAAEEGNILQTNLFIVLSSIEIVAMLRVLSIAHVAIVLPMRFLAVKCHELEGWNLARMGEALDLLYDALKKIAIDGNKLLDEDFAMGVFEKLGVKELEEYMTHLFEEKKMHVVGKGDSVLGMAGVRTELFTPTRTQNRQTKRDARKYAEVFAAEMMDVLTNPNTTSSDYLTEANGKYSIGNLSEEQVAASEGKRATNDVSESGHALSTAGLKTWGTIRLDHAGAEGQSRANNDFGRGHETRVAARKQKQKQNDDDSKCQLGTFHSLPVPLQRSLIEYARRTKIQSKKHFDDLLAEQRNAAKEKEDLAMKKKLDAETKQYVGNIYLYEEYTKPRCWRDAANARYQYNKLTSKAAKMKEVKNQILIRYLGLGWEEAHHPWSKDGRDYTHDELFEHLINVVIPLSKTKTVPNGPLVQLPQLPTSATMKLGQLTHDRVSLENKTLEGEEKFKERAHEEREQWEKRGDASKYEEWQQSTMPEINSSFVGFRIEFLFHVSYDHNTSELVWSRGEVIEIVNAKKNKVKIRWDEEWLTEGEDPVSVQELFKSLWNHTKAKAGAWRQHIPE